MAKYYKIITDHSHFADEYNIKNVAAIPFGTKFSANKPFDTSVCIQSAVPVIHFADMAFETLIWYEILTKQTDKIAIYEITPQSQVIKQQCSDVPGLCQCGAQTIRIEKQISLETLVHRVKDEFRRHKLKKTNPFPEFHVANIMYQWWYDTRTK